MVTQWMMNIKGKFEFTYKEGKPFFACTRHFDKKSCVTCTTIKTQAGS
jgi:hypothetical protein